MGKKQSGAVLRILLGKTVCLQGKFDWGEKERLQALAEAQQALIAEELTPAVTHLVIADLAGGKTVQKKAATLNSKGANIQTMDASDFAKLVAPTAEEIVTLLRAASASKPVLEKVLKTSFAYDYRRGSATAMEVVGEDLSNCDLSELSLYSLAFKNCDFTGAKLHQSSIHSAEKCTFDKADCTAATLGKINESTFKDANLTRAVLSQTVDNVDFTGVTADGLQVNGYHVGLRGTAKLLFTRASLVGAQFRAAKVSFADFQESNLTNANFQGCFLTESNFRKANLTGATLINCDLTKADLSQANLIRANLADAKLTDAIVQGADVTGANLRGAKLSDEQLKQLKGFDPNVSMGGTVGPQLKELDAVNKNAKRLQISFRLETAQHDPSVPEVVSVDSASLQWGWGLSLPGNLSPAYQRSRTARTMSDALSEAARVLGTAKVKFETVEVSTTKSATKANELRDVVIGALAEAFGQTPPEADKLAELTKAFREEQREQSSADRERRENAKKEAEKAEAARKKKAEKTIEKQVGKVTDIATFLKALELRIEKAKIQKATKMLKADGFKLFNDVKDDSMMGVIKSQTDPDLVYACRITDDGQYACCTQNLNICGGLRGSICKHLLVLIIGLVKAGELDPTTIDGWVAKSNSNKAELDKEIMGEIFIRYKGAEAGEVDWRPTETVPEDYYAL